MMNGNPPVGRSELKTMWMVGFAVESQNNELSIATNGLALICDRQDVRWTGVIAPSSQLSLAEDSEWSVAWLGQAGSFFLRTIASPPASRTLGRGAGRYKLLTST